MKTILVVDDDRATLQIASRTLLALKDLAVVTAENGALATKILAEQPVDLLVTDLQMPVMGGYQLLAYVSERHPSLPAIVITSFLDLDTWGLAMELGALRVLPKPVIPNMLQQEVKTLLEREPEGLTKGVSVGSLLMLMHWEKKHCTMTVTSRGKVGMLYVSQGDLIHASYRDREGEKAALDILAWERPSITFVEACRVERSISLDTPGLLMKASLHKDEKKAEDQAAG
ncbi:MAG TPA: response regulator [Holophagaceae bacterium]|nr:response regulator [Holophagaceae bacterium]